MINPIQQNVSFSGANNALANDSFTGKANSNSAAIAGSSVRNDYNNAVNQVLNTQAKMMQAVDENSGNKLDCIA